MNARTSKTIARYCESIWGRTVTAAQRRAEKRRFLKLPRPQRRAALEAMREAT